MSEPEVHYTVTRRDGYRGWPAFPYKVAVYVDGQRWADEITSTLWGARWWAKRAARRAREKIDAGAVVEKKRL